MMEYRLMKKKALPSQLCPWCKEWGEKKDMHPHHTQGRIGRNLLVFVWVHADCHIIHKDSIHQNPKLAKKRGFFGTNIDPPFSVTEVKGSS